MFDKYFFFLINLILKKIDETSSIGKPQDFPPFKQSLGNVIRPEMGENLALFLERQF
jgi:hypothetical protein